MSNNSLDFDRIKGGLYGLLLGDAVGRCYEFTPPSRLPDFDLIDMVPPVGFRPTYAYVPVGTWTDDGAQALALLDSLLEHKGLVLDDFAEKLCQWFDNKKYTPDGVVFDCGIQTSAALNAIKQGVPMLEAAGKDEYSNGNGALMRVLPLVLWHQGDDETLVRLAMQQGLPTHGHPRSAVVCALYCLIAKRLLEQGVTPDVDDVQQPLRVYLSDGELKELDSILTAPQRINPKGSGYVVDTFWSALVALDQDNFKDVIRSAIIFGNDTDTTACVAGGLAGIYFGYDQLPKDWLDHLQGKDIVENLLAKLALQLSSKS
jgi:ADP-ribosyl-[dinitrogen reductase] hydrolase